MIWGSVVPADQDIGSSGTRQATQPLPLKNSVSLRTVSSFPEKWPKHQFQSKREGIFGMERCFRNGKDCTVQECISEVILG